MWDYLKDSTFDERYRIVSEFLGDTSDKVVLDINCGEPRFKNFIKYKKYISTDIAEPRDKDGFIAIADKDVNIKCDILCLFGYGGGEYTGQPLESQTIIESVTRLAIYEPEYIIIEMVQKWEEDFGALKEFESRLTKYKKVLEQKYQIENPKEYHDKRLVTIFEKVCQTQKN